MSGPLALYTADEMRAVDAAAIEGVGIPGAVLMERAGLAAAEEIMRLAAGGRAAVVCGAGNNGGDGFVVARHLHTAGWEVECLLAGDVRKLPPDARLNHNIARKLGIEVVDGVRRARLTRADVVVDALLGTGFRGAPRGAVAGAIEAMRPPIGTVVALDVPSGVDASTGVVAGAAVAADVTVCFHGRKLGTAIEPGRSAACRVVVADIGIPPQADRGTAATLLAGVQTLAAAWPKAVRGSKYTAGAVLVVGGAPGYIGAPLMTALAALRASAGVAWIAAPQEAVPALEGRVPEIMVRALPDALDLLSRADAVALGPGLGRSDEAVALARRVAAEHAGPIVIDADGLFAFAGRLARLRKRPGPTVLTPHEGEMARLLGVEPGWVRANRLEAVRKAAAASGCVVLLKGSDTLVADPDGRLGVSHAGPPGLATAGSGDVLTGTVAAMLAKGGDPVLATCIAAEAHGLAGRRAVECHGPSGIIATDVIDALPEVLPVIGTAGARATVTVDLAAVAANVRRLREAAAPAEVWAVVKADGYGHSAAAVGRTALAAGAERLCVATWDEARGLRDELGDDVPVLVMGPLVPGQESEVEGVDVTVTSVEGFARLRAAARSPLGVHVKADTGMGRWGMAADDALRVGEQLADGDVLGLGGLMSHLAVADADETFTRGQIERFGELAARFPACPRHIANSAAVLRFPEARFDAVRCGIAVYGLSPFGADPATDGLIPAIRLESFVVDVKLLAAGESAGYGRRFVASEPTWIGLVPAGYADGVPRILSGRADVLVRGRRRRVAATVSMDQLTFVIGVECDVEPGDAVTLLGEDGDERILAEEWARLAGTINYEIVTSLAPRPRRVEHVLRGA